jgi:predicted enzyme related to lactoylglutathione lyase
MGAVLIWADIPVLDLPRAMKFYEHVSGQPVVQFPGMDDVAVIQASAEGEPPMFSIDLYVGGTPSKDGATIYLNPNGDINATMARAIEAGAQVDRPVAFMGPMVGWIGTFIDTEGNRIGLQQPGDGTE